ncbi:NADH dehydrogenase [ubiquinone] 1 beta subcomplex subunit 10 [Planococcus citri]|uniref:NADH dehydrogenase [ubiquinone] 1 beta subcomplex subunit 10 n=1 Tax=Planococcus citri TaxID=170843 RepID=UPI0031F9C41C
MAEFDRKNYTLLHRDWETYPPRNIIEKGVLLSQKVFVQPMIYLKKNLITPNQQTYYWYHRKYQRVPTIDQCYDYDALCHFEAERQIIRDMKVDSKILSLLFARFDECVLWEGHEKEKCRPLLDAYRENETNWFIKYGDIGQGPQYARKVFMKQKHRMLWERRHGPVGTGKKQRNYHPDGTPYYK